MVKPLIEVLKDLPDPRSKRKKKHDYAEILMLVIIGFLSGKQSLRRICSWCNNNIECLRKDLKLKGGIPSLSTFSRAVCSIDAQLLTYAFMDWIGRILDTKGIHIIIDGKALRAATEKLKDKKAPYILNAIDAATKLVIAQLYIPDKTNEMTAIPKLLEMLDITGSTVTIDAIGATSTILNLIDEKNGYFVQQVKKNCPSTYDEISDFFAELKKERDEDGDAFNEKNKNKYSEASSNEVNRERYEYRTMESYRNDERIKEIRKDIPSIVCIGQSLQVRIPKEVDEEGNDVTPSKVDFLKSGSRRCPMPTDGDRLTDNIQKVGIISNNGYTAEELAKYKREHWAIENSLHYVLDEDFNEDKCPSKKGKVALSVLRKFAYNIIRMLQINDKDNNSAMIQIMDKISLNLECVSAYMFKPIPSFY